MPDRLLHAGLPRPLMDLRTAVVDAEADHRPSVISSLRDDVYLVAAARSVLVLPQLAGRGMEREALRIAVAVAPDLGLRARSADERIIRRNRAVGSDANDLADVVGEILRLVARTEVIAHGQEQIVVGALRDATAEVIAARKRTFLTEDRLHVVEPGRAFVDQPGA